MDIITEQITSKIEWVSPTVEHQDASKKAAPLRVNHGGNYCGHKICAPRFYKTDVPNRPAFITKAKERMAEFYIKPFNHFELNSACEISKRIKKKVLIKKIRKMRSERREAITSVFNFMLDNMDVVTRRIFNNPSIQTIAKKCEISIKRAERALNDLKTSGYIHTQQRKEKNAEGKWRSISAIKTISLKVFKILGISAWYGYEKERKESKKRKKNKKGSFLQVEKIAQQISNNFDAKILEKKGAIAYIDLLRTIVEPKPEPD